MPNFNPNTPVTASQFMNDLVNMYNEYWQGASWSFGPEHSNIISRRRYGWGQQRLEVKGVPQTHEVNNQMLIEREHLNTVIAQINAGLYHINNDYLDPNSPEYCAIEPVPVASNIENVVRAHEFEDVRNKVLNIIDKNKFVCLDDKISTNTNGLGHTYSSSLPFNDNLYAVQKFTFNNYNEARHFFNSGGELTVELDADLNSGGTSSYDGVWKVIFDKIGEVRIGAVDTTNSDNDDGTHEIKNLVPNKGFYSVPHNGNYRTIFEAAGAYNDPQSAYSSGYAYAYVYAYSVYNSRRLRIEARCEELPTNEFEIHVKTTLVEDLDDVFTINAQMRITAGYYQPVNSPEFSDPGFDTNMLPKFVGIPGNTQYQFETRTPPVVSGHTPWTSDNTHTAPQVEWTSSDPGSNPANSWIQSPTPHDSNFRYYTEDQSKTNN